MHDPTPVGWQRGVTGWPSTVHAPAARCSTDITSLQPAIGQVAKRVVCLRLVDGALDQKVDRCAHKERITGQG